MELISEALRNAWSFEFDVRDPRKAIAGHTVYRLVLKISKNLQSSPYYKFIGWKRYSDFRKLHKDLKSTFSHIIHDEGFPEFAKPKLFGRFDEDVIEERRMSSIKLLRYVTEHPQVLEHDLFAKFIQSSDKHHSGLGLNRTHSSSSSSDAGRLEHGTASMEQSVFLEAEVKQEDDPIISSSVDIVDSPDRLPVQKPDFSVQIDQQNGEDVSGVSPENNSQLFGLQGNPPVFFAYDLYSEALVDCPLSVLSDSLGIVNSSPLTIIDDHGESTGSLTRPFAGDPGNLTDALASMKVIGSSHQEPRSDESYDATKFQEMLRIDEKMSKVIERTVEEDDYLLQANLVMSNALEQEDLGNFQHTFEMYKLGIGLLLKGVQSDKDVARREAVRRKCAQYLLRAENLYQSKCLDKSLDVIVNNNFQVLDSKRRFKLDDVKIIGVVDKLMLVQDIHSEAVLAMKVLHKCGAEYARSLKAREKCSLHRTLVNCKYMAKLLNCVEKPTGIYLLLEYVEGGRLWDYLGLRIFDLELRKHSFLSEHHSLTFGDRSLLSIAHRGVFSELPTMPLYNGAPEEIDIVDLSANNGTEIGEIEVNKLAYSEKNRSDPYSICDNHRIASPMRSFQRCRSVTSSQSEWISEETSRVWLSQIALGLMNLHARGIICRDLNPRNVLLDTSGCVKLTYFSRVDGIDYEIDENAAHCLYTAPEIEGVFDIAEAADWWSFGVLMFELLTGQSLHSCHPDGIHPSSVITIPRRVSNEACALLTGLLQFDPKDRLGSGPTGGEEIKSHPFFASVIWEQL